jgi:hypothetical protein
MQVQSLEKEDKPHFFLKYVFFCFLDMLTQIPKRFTWKERRGFSNGLGSPDSHSTRNH